MFRNPTLRIVLCLAAILSFASLARADYQAGRTAWQAGRHAEALTQWQAAARAGDGKAMLALGQAFARGLGVPQDYILAHMWLNLAAGRGNAEAARERETLAANMIPQHIALAQERARAWLSGRGAGAPKAAAVASAAAPSAAAGPPPPRAIREAQGLMAALGYKPGPADGRWGSGTAKAYAAFLRDAGMPPEEVLTPAALRAMRAIAKDRKPAKTNATASTATTSTSRESAATSRQTKKSTHAARSTAVPFVGCDEWYGPTFFRVASLETVKKCLRSGLEPQGRNLFKSTPLHVAASSSSNPAVITALLNAGADAKARNTIRVTPLHKAASNRTPAVAARLLKAGADPLARNKWGEMPLDRAVEGNRAVASILVEAIRDPTKRVRYGISTLHIAALGEETAVVSSLLKSGANPNWQYNNRSTPLHWAAANNQAPAVVVALLKAGANLHGNKNVGTPLHWAALNENSAIAAALLKAGADPNAATTWKWTPLHWAAKSNPQPAVALALIQAGANVKARNKQGDTPLHLAASFNKNPAVVAALLKAGADPNAKGEYGKPPLESAARFQNNPAVFATLLKAGANPNARSGSGYTPLHSAAWHSEDPAVIAVLIEGGADPNAREKDGTVPLHFAAKYNRNPAVVAALLRAGANPDARNKYGKSALDSVHKNKNPAVATLLRTGVVPGTQDNSRATPEKYASKTRDASAAAAASAPAGPPPPRAIREAQGLMAALGYKPGPADGRWGPRTGRAYAAFLRDRGLPPGNVLTLDALRAMRAAAKGGNVVVRAVGARTAPATQRKAAHPPANLHRLVAAGDIDGLKAALARGADANARDGKGWTPLMHAADDGRTLLVPPLLKAGADANIRASDGATALFIAAVHGHSEILSFLLAAEADPSIKGPKGMTAIDAARARYGTFYEAQENGEQLDILTLLAKGLTIRDVVNVLNRKFVQCDGRATGLRASLSGKDTIRIGVRHREGRLGEYEINITTIRKGTYIRKDDVIWISDFAQNIRSLHENKNIDFLKLPTCGDQFAKEVLQLLADAKSLALSGLIDVSLKQRSETTTSEDWREGRVIKYFR